MMSGLKAQYWYGGAVALAAVLGMSIAAPAMAADKTKITLLYPIAVGGPLEGVINGLVDEFEAANPTIEVDAVYAGGYRDVEVSARAAIAGGDAPAVALMEATQMYELIDLGFIKPFDDLAKTPEDRAWLGDFYPAFMSNSKDEAGKTWGIPFQRSTAVQYWNKDLFKKAGLDPDKAPATWDELIQVSKKLQADGGADWGVGIPSSSSWMYQSIALQNGVVLSAPDGKSADFTNPAAIEALQWYADLSLVHKVQAPGVIASGTLPQAFFEGKFAIMWQSTGSLTHVLENAPFEVGVGMLPGNKRRGATAGGANFYVFSAASEEKQQAGFEFVKFLTRPENAARWTVATGYVAPTPKAWEVGQLKELAAKVEGYAVARDQLEFSDRMFATFSQGRTYGLLNSAVQEAITGQNSAKDILTRLQGEADAILAPYNK
ncbi:ABC transporter substrate-binding protein [Aminobacter sp. HY435]|uniref:ABC transporter substrate-binding protein n=1 Tax=Aminobacter sp. HY435 TaxID=2970917 RepID=UPI0022B96874|nr:ABC transporter substrate-binding protein [Aminobacter sp. HY435]